MAMACAAAGGRDQALPMPGLPRSPAPSWVGIAHPPVAGSSTVRGWRTVTASLWPRPRCTGGGAQFNVETQRQQRHVALPVALTPRHVAGIAVSPATTATVADSPHRRFVHCPRPADSGHHYPVHFAPSTSDSVPHSHNDTDCPRVADSQHQFRVHVSPSRFQISSATVASTVRESRIVDAPQHATPCHGNQLNAPCTRAGGPRSSRVRPVLGCPWSVVHLSHALFVVCGVPLFLTLHLQPPLFWDPPICSNCYGGPVPHLGVPIGPPFRLLAYLRCYPCRPISVWAFPRWPRFWLGWCLGQNPHAPAFLAHLYQPHPQI